MRSSVRWGVEEPKVTVTFEIGETVRVISGPFENLDGIVQEVSPPKGGRLRVQVSMFEREIPVELDFTDVENTSTRRGGGVSQWRKKSRQ